MQSLIKTVNWFIAVIADIWRFMKHVGRLIRPNSHPAVYLSGFFSLVLLIAMLTYISRASVQYSYQPAGGLERGGLTEYAYKAVRPEPDRFRSNTHLPRKGEARSSGGINLKTFFPEYDLIRIDDPRVWWESDHDVGDTEDDHIIHYEMELPLKRLIELVDQAGGQLKVQDSYRDKGIHNSKSLHKEGRAIDLTSNGISLERLAKLCWASGFDWVYYESPKKGGAHIHCSIRVAR